MQAKPDILYSAAVMSCETTKLVLSVLYIIFVDGGSFDTIRTFIMLDYKNMLLLTVPATVYNVQQTLEYVALKNLDASIFSVLVQTKLLATAIFAVVLMGRKLSRAQTISLALLTSGVMMCNMKGKGGDPNDKYYNNSSAGIFATLGIALSSGFASVYTEKVIKVRGNSDIRSKYSLAYIQVQMASASLIIIILWAVVVDFGEISRHGLFKGFSPAAALSVFNSAIGGLTVAAVLKFADAVLKGYATALSVVLTGILSMFFFGTHLSTSYILGIVNVMCSMVLYNNKNLHETVSCG